MIKVIANSTEQAIEIIQAFENSDAKIVIDIKENTTTENSDVACWNTSQNPMTKNEWDEHKKNSVSTSNPNQKI